MSITEEERWYARMIESRTDQVFAIDAIDAKKPTHVGLCGIHEIEWKNRAATVGILIGGHVGGGESAQGKGYGTDAMRTLVKYAHDELNLHRIELEVFTDNARAIKSYEKIGFAKDGVRRAAMWKDGAYRDLMVMSVLPGEIR
jgi:RimJ/RimL family protein N-acetyltransferase